MNSRQKGFTLVEIAVVLLIIGLLLGGVLKGQELIDSAKVKNLAQDFRAVPALLHAYQDRFRALPGDDRRAVLHLCGSEPACTAVGDGNGIIRGNWDDTDDSEAFRFWQHVRLANLSAGSTDVDSDAYLPTHALGGRLGVQQGGSLLGLGGSLVVCAGGIAGKFVRQLDIALDDGDPARGAMRAGTGSGADLSLIGADEIVADSSHYTVCASV